VVLKDQKGPDTAISATDLSSGPGLSDTRIIRRIAASTIGSFALLPRSGFLFYNRRWCGQFKEMGRWGTRALPCKTPRRADQCLPHNAVGHRGYKEIDCHVGNLSRRTLGGRIGGGGLGPRFLTRRMGSMDVLG
jgi:hypothetical protein